MMTPEEYQIAVNSKQNLIIFKGKLINIPILISPSWRNYPFLKHLGSQPYNIKENDSELYIEYPGGRVEYYLDPEHMMLLPSIVTIYGVPLEDGKRALNTEVFDTKLIFSNSKDNPEISDENLFIDLGDFSLRLDVFEGEKQIPKDWWNSEKKG